MRGDPAGSLDAWTTLAGLAARTERHPARHDGLAGHLPPRRRCSRRPSTTVDHISNGRVELGIGAGWFEAEHETYGFPFLTTRERLDELDRQLEEIDRASGPTADDVWPKPVQQPRPPIIVGGTRQAAHRARRRPLRRRVQHGLPDASRRRASASASSTTPRAKPAASRCASR